MSDASDIIKAALAAHTIEDAVAVQAMIAKSVGATYQRPIGDRWSNIGHLTRVGNSDHKLLENVTNAQDAVLELFALQKFGSAEAVPYTTPHEAAARLLGHLTWQQAAQLVTVELHDSDEPDARRSGRLTAIFRDEGAGMSPAYLSQSIFYLGSRHKGKANWQQGAFGLGGASTFRHARAVSLVTRRHPDLLGSEEEDRVAVAICLWEEIDKGSGIYYLTTSDWASGGDLSAEPWSAPSSDSPDFTPGTHIALISYEPERIHSAAWGGEYSFERMLNTRLFEPVIPVRIDNRISSKAHPQNYRGLKRQFAENPREDRKEAAETMPFMLDGNTYHLQVSAYYFEAGPRADIGGKRNFVNPEHALMFVSNGQVHHHWQPADLRKTELRHIADRLLVVVDLDDLPIRARTRLFPPERQGFVDLADTRRLQQQVIELLNDWDELMDFDRDVMRKALAGDRTGRPTIDIARQIGRALKFKGGFRFAGANGAANGRKRRKKLAKSDLYADPTTIEGPATLSLEQGQTRFVRYHVNAVDDFGASRRGRLEVTCDHPEIGERDITVGVLHNGFIRVAIAVPETADLGDYGLTATVGGWQRAAGGVGADLVWHTRAKVVEPVSEEQRRDRQRPSGGQRANGDGGDLVGIIWRGVDAFPDDWHPGVPGHVDEVEAAELAAADEGYKDLAKLGETKIPTIFLNQEYTPLKKYEAARAREGLTERGIDDSRDRYAVGAGLGLLLLDRELKTKRGSNGNTVSPEVELAAKQAAAQATLVMMPQYDRLAKAAGVED